MTKVIRHQPRKIDDAMLRRLWSSRLSDCAVAKQMGHRPGVLRRRAAKLGLPPRREIWADKP
jgi:hypothetical protein